MPQCSEAAPRAGSGTAARYGFPMLDPTRRLRNGRAAALLLALAGTAIGCVGRPGAKQEAGPGSAEVDAGAARKLDLARKLLARQRAETAAVAGWADRSLAAAAEPVFGPGAGEIRRRLPGGGEEDEGGPALERARIRAADLIVEVRFTNPPRQGDPWDYGLGVRDGEAGDVRVYLNADGLWAADFAAGDGPPHPGPSGRAAAFDPAPGAANTLRLAVRGDGALLAVNGAYTALIALPAAPGAGDVYVGAGFVERESGPEPPVRYAEFRVWRIGGDPL